EYIPTCHRASFDSFLEDIDFLAAVKNSEGVVQKQYQKDGKRIEEVRQGILATSSGEDPFDVFICYKETDQNGGRTQDSVLAQDIYDQLSEKGYKVFFSRITLEDKVGTQYEPYIFAALNSAKVMIVVGTSKENLDAVWVKNEWSRFLYMMRKDRSKAIIPCYKDMNPYDMPEALSALQSYNMAAMGFHQDLLRGISKILGANTARSTEAFKPVNEEVKPLLERVFLFLEDGKYKEADEYAEKVLDKDPKNTEAYIGKLMSEMQVNKREDIGRYAGDLEDFDSYKKAIKFASNSVRDELFRYKESSTNENNRRREQKSKRIKIILSLIAFIALAGFATFFINSKIIIPEKKYKSAEQLMEAQRYDEAIIAFTNLEGYRDSDAKIAICRQKIEEKKVEEQQSREKELLENKEKNKRLFEEFVDEGKINDAIELYNVTEEIDKDYAEDYLYNAISNKINPNIDDDLSFSELSRDVKEAITILDDAKKMDIYDKMAAIAKRLFLLNGDQL
nr:toll/interleukin-1 receptor domain-containing protein [Lachnospiraceae bacterium]